MLTQMMMARNILQRREVNVHAVAMVEYRIRLFFTRMRGLFL